MKNIAVMDLGANTVRLLIACPVGREKDFQTVYTKQKIVRMGKGLSRGGLLTGESIERTMAALKDFTKEIERFDAKEVIAVATSALREAENGKDLTARIKREFGFDVDIISGEEEGRLTMIGVMKAVKEPCLDAILIDIGGGSTEFIQVVGGELQEVLSLDMGVVGLFEEFLFSDPVARREVLDMEERISQKICSVKKELFNNETITLIGTAGTFTTLAAIDLEMELYDPETINGYLIRLERIKEIFKKLTGTTLKERREIRGLERGRADVIIPGTAIAIKIMEYFGCAKVMISDFGLREGILVNYL